MAERSQRVLRLLARLRQLREDASIAPDALAEQLILGPGWIERFESGETLPDIETLLALTDYFEVDPSILFKDLGQAGERANIEIHRTITCEQSDDDLFIHFQYGDYDATYCLESATVDEFELVLKSLRDGLARLVSQSANSDDEKAIKKNAVASAFLKSIELWPKANPSDLWWFIIYRAYCDPFNHPAQYARLSFEQSWKRTGGWALEEILVRHYGPKLSEYGIGIEIATGERKERLLSQLTVRNRLEADKVDVVLYGPGEVCFGVVHVKASFAERRTDDVPMSEALVEAGYCSPLWTMDCKSTPAAQPFNRGELGAVVGKRSAKRKDIEDDGLFSACFSYNRNTKPTPDHVQAQARIYCCDFSDPDDDFVRFIRSSWDEFSRHRNSIG